MEDNFGIYTGIVVQNSDPEGSGRVKVYVPGINSAVYDGWTDESTNKEFSLIDGGILNIIDQLREDLPWAPCANGLFSGGTDRLSVNDAPVALERPSDAKVKAPPVDAFGTTNYTPGDYSGTSSGKFGVPNIGAHVYVFFQSGNTMFPIYFATAHNKENWADIFKDGNYPTDKEFDNSDEYKSKEVLNSNKHTLEFIDSDQSEEVRLSHFSGSNIRMLNDFNSRYAVNDDYSLVDHDQIETVGNDKYENVGNDLTEFTGNDHTDTIVHDFTQNVGNDTTITVGNFTTILSTNSATINCNGKSILVLNPDGTIVITGTTSIAVTAPLINYFANDIMNLTAGSVINLTAPIINLNK